MMIIFFQSGKEIVFRNWLPQYGNKGIWKLSQDTLKSLQMLYNQNSLSLKVLINETLL